VALSAVLLAGSAGVARGFYRVRQVPLGFRIEGALSFALHLPAARYPDAASGRRLCEGLLERLRALPSVEAAGTAASLPLTIDYSVGWFEIEGRPPWPKEDEPVAQYQRADAGYFGSLGIALKRGRLFDEHDREGAEPVMVVNESFARRHFPGEDPVGKRVRWTLSDKQWRTVVGVVGDVRLSPVAAEVLDATYVPYSQTDRARDFEHVYFTVRTAGDPRAVANAARAALAELDAELPLADVKTYDERVRDSLADRRFTLALVAAFASSALLLTALGLFGLVSYQTKRRARELAVRMALGAGAADVTGLVMRDTARLLLAGLALGLPAAFASGKLLAARLEDVPPPGPLALGATAFVLGAVALAAVLAPARRAARTPPALVLRDE
jgi:predicted permease